MENNANQITSNYCKRNCGFFGNQAFDGYCSKCYKEHVKRQNSGTAAGRVTPTSVSLNSDSTSSMSAVPSTASLNNSVNTTVEVAAAAAAQPVAPTNIAEQPAATTTSTKVEFNLNDIEMSDSNNNSVSNDSSNNNSNEAIVNPNQLNVNSATNTLPENASTSSLSSSSGDGEKKSKRTRCNVDTCRRKLGLTGFDCRCGGIFCSEHRYSDKHSCQFDYKQLGQEQIRKNNPVVVGEKIQKI